MESSRKPLSGHARGRLSGAAVALEDAAAPLPGDTGPRLRRPAAFRDVRDSDCDLDSHHLRGRIPGWMFDFQVRLIDWQARAIAYTALLTDTYPAFEGVYPVRFDAEYPERVSRWKVLIWKYVTSIPHSIVLQFLWIGAFFASSSPGSRSCSPAVIPKGLHGFVVGVGRWQLRVQAYMLSLTDEFPPFSLSGNAGAAGRDTYVISSVIGGLLYRRLRGSAYSSSRSVVMPGADRFSVSYAALEGRQRRNDGARLARRTSPWYGRRTRRTASSRCLAPRDGQAFRRVPVGDRQRPESGPRACGSRTSG